MQIYLGSAYVNDFDFNNRAYRVYVQADKAFRSDPKSLEQYYARTDAGSMVPLANVVRVRETTAPQVISHYNLFRSAEINGGAAPGFSSGQAIEEMEALAKRALPQGFGFAWSGPVARGDQGRAPVDLHLRHRAAARLPDARGAVRILRPAVHRPAGRAAGGARRADGAGAARPAERHLLPDRPGHADRARSEERDPDRRVRRAAPRSRDCRSWMRRSKPRASACGRF